MIQIIHKTPGAFRARDHRTNRTEMNTGGCISISLITHNFPTISPVSRIVNTLDVIVKIFTGRASFSDCRRNGQLIGEP